MAKKKKEVVQGATHFADLLGMDAPKQDVEEVYKATKLSPFDFVNAIHYSKEELIVDEETEKQYNPFIVNRALSFGSDTVLFANEMNARPHISKLGQFKFLCAAIRPRKRFNKWLKAEKVENLDLVMEYFDYSAKKAQEALRILTPTQLEYIRERLNRGGAG
jgi:hypothetical protein